MRDNSEIGVPMIIVGNKSDLTGSNCKISWKKGQELATKQGTQFIQTSALKNENVDLAF